MRHLWHDLYPDSPPSTAINATTRGPTLVHKPPRSRPASLQALGALLQARNDPHNAAIMAETKQANLTISVPHI